MLGVIDVYSFAEYSIYSLKLLLRLFNKKAQKLCFKTSK